MKYFIAINVSNDIKEELISIQDRARSNGVSGENVSPEKMHLNLAYIGEYDNPKRLLEVLDDVEIKPFELSLGRVGAIRDHCFVEVENNKDLQRVVRNIRRKLAVEGIPLDRRRFLPKIKLIQRAEIEPKMVSELHLNISRNSMEVDHISLMGSETTEGESVYTEL